MVSFFVGPCSVAASFSYLSTLMYINPVFKTGKKRQLNKKDIFKIRKSESSEVNGGKLLQLWEEEKANKKEKGSPNFFKCMLKFVAHDWFLAFLGFFVAESLKIIQTVILKNLLYIISSTNYGENNDSYIWATALFLAMILQWFVNHPTFLNVEIMGIKLKTAAMTLVYDKVLVISNSKLGAISPGHVITMFSSDAQKIQEGLKLTAYLILGPLYSVVGVILLWNELGPSCLVGIGVLLLIIPLQSWFGKLFGQFRLKALAKTDERVSAMNEIITSMQVTKMYTWEDSFYKKIQKLRKEESYRILKSAMMKAVNTGLTSCSQYVILFSIFSVYYYYGERITVAKVYFTMSVFYILRVPVVLFFPLAVQMGMEFYVSCKRIEKFLLQQEIVHLDSKDGNNSTYLKFENVTASWNGEFHTPILHNISFTVDEKKSLLMIHGPVGCGKTSIFMAILNEIKLKSGKIKFNGQISYAAQQSWIFSGTIRENILFGREYDETFFNKVIEACALLPDFESFSKREYTLVGERGVSLSGGQKARINLARAVYRDADIYLLDDPLSAVDVKVGKHIFNRCIKGLLKKKVVLMVTHQIQYLSEATDTLELNCNQLQVNECNDKINGAVKGADKDSSATFQVNTEQVALSGNKKVEADKTNENVEEHFNEQEEEYRKKGRVAAQDYVFYFLNGIGLIPSILLFLLLIFTQVIMTLIDYWLGEWAEAEDLRHNNITIASNMIDVSVPSNNLYLFTGLVILGVIVSVASSTSTFAALIQCSRQLHNRMFETIIKVPMFFFNTNPIGQILNRFSGDISLMDDELPWVFTDLIKLCLLTIAVVVINCISVPYLTILVVVLIVPFVYCRNYFMMTSREIRRLEAVDRSPLFSHLSSTLAGISTIRSFGLQKEVTEEFVSCLDYQSESKLMFLFCSRWFAQRLDLAVVLFLSICAFAPVVMMQYMTIDVGLVGVSLTYLLPLCGMFDWCVRQSAEVDTLMTSVERVTEYTKLEVEKDLEHAYDLPNSWMSGGLIVADSASYAYHRTLPNVLNEVSFTIQSKEKIGIVGRTGAGKSSLISMLFRLGNNSGIVQIDGYDISRIKLKVLRHAISVIPQDPVLFGRSLRKNLDPFDEYSDEAVWNSLEEVQMKHTVQQLDKTLLTQISEAGNNLSIGERQLLCLARALLKNNKILLVDEATANVDHKTDALIQTTIRERFKNCTVLTIAHRLNTIMDSDRIMVLHEGRIAEFDKASVLLQNKNGLFTKMVAEAGI